jgi:GT2 family glycosyltransferase
MTTIIVPSKHNDIFQDCRASLDKFAPSTPKILVRDGHDIAGMAVQAPFNWRTVQAPEPFIYARNINLGIKACEDDVFLCNDDVQFVDNFTIGRLQFLMQSHPEVGILSPRILGGVGNVLQSMWRGELVESSARLAFVAVMIRRSVIDKVGLLDEQFTGYGFDDTDYCLRTQRAGFKLAIAGQVVVTHGHGKQNASSSYRREPNFLKLIKEGEDIYARKWSKHTWHSS